LARKKDKFIYSMCQNIRKGGGTLAAKGITAEMEEDMQMFKTWCTYRYFIQRDYDYDQATRSNLSETWEWKDQLPPDPATSAVQAFQDIGDKRVWFESIRNYLSQKKGAAGLPILYGIRPDTALPLDDPGFGLPDHDSELYNRGRHNGSNWKSDNAMIWQLVWDVSHGTTAWNTISSFEATKNGRGAMLALVRQYMGSDVQQVLIRNAETFLENTRFDGKSRNLSWDVFVGQLRQAFKDLGPEDQMSEQRMVTKLVRAFQMPELQHLDAMITGDLHRKSNFESAVVFLSDQIAALKTKNIGSHPRSIGAMDSSDGKKSSKYKSHKKSHKTKHPRATGKKDDGSFDKDDPGKYQPPDVWRALEPHQQVAARDARKADGIPTREERKMSALDTTGSDTGSETTTATDSDTDSDSGTDSDEDMPMNDVAAPPQARQLHMTQRVTQQVRAANHNKRKAAKKAAKQALKKTSKAKKNSKRHT
jgi:hypothetical protein